MNKKGFMITPILFIVFFLIAVIYSFYVSDIDREISYGVQTAATIEKGIHDVQKEQINQISFVKLTAYKCAKASPCNITQITPCVKGNLTEFLGNDLEFSITNNSGVIMSNFNLSSFNATNINMISDNVIINVELNKKLFGC